MDSVHEVGHLLGLAHNASESSVMFFFGLDKFGWLEPSDLTALSMKHSLRPGFFLNHGFARLPVTVPTQAPRSRLNPVSWLEALRLVGWH